MPLMNPLKFLVILSLFLTSCGLFKSVAIRSTADLLQEAGQKIQEEPNWELFRAGVPGALKNIEGLWSLDPSNEDLLASLTKGFSGYGFAVMETLAYEENLSGRGGEHYREQAVYYYNRALRYGFSYLKEAGITFRDLVDANRDAKQGQDGVILFLEDELSSDSRDVETVFYTGQAWLGLINLNRSSPVLTAQLGLAKSLVNWACLKKPDLNHGTCLVVEGVYQASRPKMLGGNPKKGKEIFLKAMKEYPGNFLIPVAYLQYYVIPRKDRGTFEVLSREVHKKLKIFDQENLAWNPSVQAKSKVDPSMNLLNAIAQKRFEAMQKHQNKVF